MGAGKSCLKSCFNLESANACLDFCKRWLGRITRSLAKWPSKSYTKHVVVRKRLWGPRGLAL